MSLNDKSKTLRVWCWNKCAGTLVATRSLLLTSTVRKELKWLLDKIWKEHQVNDFLKVMEKSSDKVS